MEIACVFIGFAICSVLVYGLLFYITSFLGPKPRTNGAQSSMPHIFTVEDRALAQWLKAHNITSGHPVFVQFEYQ